MKKVYSSNSQVAHLWANQTQSEARAGSVFFQGTKLYSYGYHYLSGEIHGRKGTKFAIVNSNPYSTTTAKHLSEARGAVSGLMPYFCSPTPSDPKATVRWLDGQAKGTLNGTFKRMKVQNRDAIRYHIEQILDAYKKANHLRTILGMAPLKVNENELNKVRDHLESRLNRYHELDTPEMIVKREHQANLRALATARKQEFALAESIQKFRRGEAHAIYGNLPFELLRIQGDTVRTSRGAEVPLNKARTLCRALMLGKSVLGAKVGEFTIVSVKAVGDDKAVKIGCHTVLLSEARSVLGL